VKENNRDKMPKKVYISTCEDGAVNRKDE